MDVNINAKGGVCWHGSVGFDVNILITEFSRGDLEAE